MSCKACYVAEILEVNIDYPYVPYSFSIPKEKLKSSIKYEIYCALFISTFVLNLPLLFII